MTAKPHKVTTGHRFLIRVEGGDQVNTITLAMLRQFRAVKIPMMFRDGLKYLTIQLQTETEAIPTRRRPDQQV